MMGGSSEEDLCDPMCGGGLAEPNAAGRQLPRRSPGRESVVPVRPQLVSEAALPLPSPSLRPAWPSLRRHTRCSARDLAGFRASLRACCPPLPLATNLGHPPVTMLAALNAQQYPRALQATTAATRPPALLARPAPCGKPSPSSTRACRRSRAVRVAWALHKSNCGQPGEGASQASSSTTTSTTTNTPTSQASSTTSPAAATVAGSSGNGNGATQVQASFTPPGRLTDLSQANLQGWSDTISSFFDASA